MSEWVAGHVISVTTKGCQLYVADIDVLTGTVTLTADIFGGLVYEQWRDALPVQQWVARQYMDKWGYRQSPQVGLVPFVLSLPIGGVPCQSS